MWTCPERVIRNGYLVAYEGEVMGEDEARRRGILPPVEPDEVEEPDVEPAPKRKGKR